MKTADLSDRHGEDARICLADWRRFGAKTSLYGRVQTISTFEDAALIRQTLGSAGEGRVLVVDAGASRRAAVLGDRMARIGIHNGWSGVLVHGAVRDIDILGELDFGVHALASVPMRAGKAGTGEVGGTLMIGGVTIRPGDFIAIDCDGVVVLSGEVSL